MASACEQVRTSGRLLLRAGGTAVLLDLAGAGLPRVLHWGADLELPRSSLSEVVAALEPGVPRGALDSPCR